MFTVTQGWNSCSGGVKMEKFIILIAFGTALFFLLLGLADFVMMLVDRMLMMPERDPGSTELTLTLNNEETTEMQLRCFLWQVRRRAYGGRITVVALDPGSYIIAEKILLKYPNIGLLYQKDLNYNI